MIGMGYLMGMSCSSIFGNGLSRSDFSELDYEKCLNDPIVESVTPLFSFEGTVFISRYFLELPKKEEVERFIERQIRGRV
ncbi:hypothetical protein Mhun_1668 [Methanospirillum hungatei JF-1]|jgi:hypothetical protein|uniref:Uncharacterized protein n=1 Tax=Methanospirillum hungatei JF-1 (strain ATCC 27890 / DSM 864 / NBRC 100397 / JF-1) TaxID=323259 RepID=Q2FL02_METHJ|nr:hypothetical protein Mhun_1668 [Methanospirillum hungatei JF-1]